jgi:hypothetical protein
MHETASVLAPTTALCSLQNGSHGRAVPQNCELHPETISISPFWCDVHHAMPRSTRNIRGSFVSSYPTTQIEIYQMISKRGELAMAGAETSFTGYIGEIEEVSERWLEVFALIERAGGARLPELKSLDRSDRFKIKMNWLAFFFGPIYFLAMGLWRQVVSYLTLMALYYNTADILMLNVFGMTELPFPFLSYSLVWGMLANRSYYKRQVLGEKNWL